MAISVETVPGPLGDMEPQALWFGERRLIVKEIVDRWFSLEQTWFKVDAEDGQLYVLRHDLDTDRWELAALTRRDGVFTRSCCSSSAATRS